MTANQSTDRTHMSAILQDVHTYAKRPKVPLTMPKPVQLDLSQVPNEDFLRHRVDEGLFLEQITYSTPAISNVGALAHAINVLSMQKKQ